MTASILLVQPKFAHNVGAAIRATSCFGGDAVYYTARSGGAPPPTVSGAHTGTNAGPPANSGARTAATVPAPGPPARVPSYTGPPSLGKNYSYGGRVYVYHPRGYYHSAPDPYDPYDYRNFDNPFSPYYHEHLVVQGVSC